MLNLYYFPVSEASSPVLFLLHHHKIPFESHIIDLMQGGQFSDEYTKMNPAQKIPTLVDGDLVLTESTAILKYIAQKHDSSWYPSSLVEQAKVDEALSFVKTEASVALMGHFIRTQLLKNEENLEEVVYHYNLEVGRMNGKKKLKVIEEHYLADGRSFLTGEAMSIADAYLASIVCFMELVDIDLSNYPNTHKWYSRIKQVEGWSEAFGPIYGFKDSVLVGAQFESFHSES